MPKYAMCSVQYTPSFFSVYFLLSDLQVPHYFRYYKVHNITTYKSMLKNMPEEKNHI